MDEQTHRKAPLTHPSDGESFDPPNWFVDQANVSAVDGRDGRDPDGTRPWQAAADRLDWEVSPDAQLANTDDGLRWFPGGRLNACYNCVDRHVAAGRKNTVAIRWEGRTGETETYTYLDLYRAVNEAAAAFLDLGVEEGDVVTLYMPVIPALPVSMLACARIGALHNVVYAGYSSSELAARMERTGSRVLVTCDGYYRRGSAVNQKNKADNACLSLDHDVETVVVCRFEDTYLSDDQYDYDSLVARQDGVRVDPVERTSADPLFVIYTSGTTGEPDLVTHTTGGYLAHAAWTSHAVLDVEPEDTYWCAADIAWITGHSYIVYGPLALGASTLLYEGAPDQPEKDKLWDLVERHAVDVFYTAPTAIRAFMKWGQRHPDAHDLSSLRLLGTVGEPINPRAWRWYRDTVGGGECPVVDTWWQTETGGILVSTLPGVDRMKPGVSGPPVPGIEVSVVDESGDEVATGEPGLLAVETPWPGMPLSLARAATDDEWRYVTADRAVVDDDGYVTLLGRSADVLSVDGRAVGTATIEGAIMEVDGVAEAAVVQSTSRDGFVVYLGTEQHLTDESSLRDRIVDVLEATFGPSARPEEVVFTPELPKTHSGKILRRLLSDIVEGEEYGDTSALRNPETVGEIEMVVRGETLVDE